MYTKEKKYPVIFSFFCLFLSYSFYFFFLFSCWRENYWEKEEERIFKKRDVERRWWRNEVKEEFTTRSEGTFSLPPSFRWVSENRMKKKRKRKEREERKRRKRGKGGEGERENLWQTHFRSNSFSLDSFYFSLLSLLSFPFFFFLFQTLSLGYFLLIFYFSSFSLSSSEKEEKETVKKSSKKVVSDKSRLCRLQIITSNFFLSREKKKGKRKRLWKREIEEKERKFIREKSHERKSS